MRATASSSFFVHWAKTGCAASDSSTCLLTPRAMEPPLRSGGPYEGALRRVVSRSLLALRDPEHDGEVFAAADAELRVDPVQVVVDRPHRHVEAVGDGPARQAGGRQLGDLAFP